MSKKDKKVVSLVDTGTTDAEIIETPEPVLVTLPDVDQKDPAAQATLNEALKVAEDQKRTQLQNTLGEAFEQHKEHGSLAFELLRAVLTQKLDYVERTTDVTKLVKGVCDIAAVFKQEVNARWAEKINEVTASVYGVQAPQSTQKEEERSSIN